MTFDLVRHFTCYEEIEFGLADFDLASKNKVILILLLTVLLGLLYVILNISGTTQAGDPHHS